MSSPPTNQPFLIAASLGRHGFDLVTSSSSPGRPPDGKLWIALIPADGTVPEISQANTEVADGDKPVDGEIIPEAGMMGAFERLDLSSGKVYAYRG